MTPDNVLRQILATVSTKGDWESLSGRGRRLVTGRVFEQNADLRTFDMLNPRVSEPFVDGPQAKIVSSKRDTLPCLATLRRGADGEWRLRSFEWQCPACFSAGVLGNHLDWEICGSCGGSRWGGRY
jgi:ribosomal protein S27AE